MTFKQYLSDQKWLIATFLLLLFFISVIIYVDPKQKITLDSLIYLLILSMFIIILYFITSYFYKRKQLNHWQEFVVDGLGSASRVKSYEGKVYLRAVQQLNEGYLSQIQEMNEISKEQLEFMTHWFHEIKTPIAVSKLLLETELNRKSLQEEMNRIENYVEQALYFSRLHEFNKDYLIQEVNLEKLIKQIIASESKTFIAKRIRVNVPNQNMKVLSDSKALTYIIRQLVLNSLKYTEEDGEISFSLYPATKQLIIRDNGIGIPPEDVPRVFEKGFTGKNGRKFQHSTGMGLFLAKKTAEKLGHELTLVSQEGEFTEAMVTFPAQNHDYYDM